MLIIYLFNLYEQNIDYTISHFNSISIFYEFPTNYIQYFNYIFSCCKSLQKDDKEIENEIKEVISAHNKIHQDINKDKKEAIEYKKKLDQEQYKGIDKLIEIEDLSKYIIYYKLQCSIKFDKIQIMLLEALTSTKNLKKLIKEYQTIDEIENNIIGYYSKFILNLLKINHVYRI